MKRFSGIVLLTGILFIAMFIMTGCNQNKKQKELLKLGIHTVIVKEHIPTSQYSYLRLSEMGNPKIKETDTLWVAVLANDYKVGDTMYYKGGFPMRDFKSRELNRSFKEVLFLDSLSKTSDFVKREIAAVPQHRGMMSMTDTLKPGKPVIEKLDVKIEKAAGGITIAELFAKKASYEGKKVKIKGQVGKFSPEIMGKNWIHIQDGTESNGKFDLTLTTDGKAEVGDIITVEGKVALDKDLGYDYFYEVLIEDAKISK